MARRKETPDDLPPRKPPRPGKPLQAFDEFLNRGLHAMFDDVAHEPIPEELLRLLKDDQKKSEGDQKK